MSIQLALLQRLGHTAQADPPGRWPHGPVTGARQAGVTPRASLCVVSTLGAVAACPPLLAGVSSVSLLALLPVGAGLGLLAGMVVAAPVTPCPVGRSELGLRAAVGGTAVTIALAAAAELLGTISITAGRFVFTVVILSLLLGSVAVASWRDQDRSGTIVRSDPQSDDGDAEAEALPEMVPLPPLCALVKRGLDIVVAGTTMVVALPIVALAAVAIAVESPGGWLFRQTRLGAQGHPFQMLKLRTMHRDNDDSEHRAYLTALIRGEVPVGGLYKLTDDPRRTRVGGLLRRFSIDELPQLWNVLKGDMSVVGPRPPLASEAEVYDTAAWRRMAAKPGLTGLWQVSGRSRLSFAEMVELDVRYWQQWTPLLDLKILLLTPKVVLWSQETA